MNRTISEITQVNPGLSKKPRSNDLVAFIPMAGVSESGRLIYFHEKPWKMVNKGFTLFQDNDVLFAKITPCMENGKGALAQGLTNGIGAGSTEFHVLRTTEDGCPSFVHQLLQSRELRQKAEMQMTGSAGQRRVPTAFFKEYRTFIPPLPQQRKIAHILSTCDAVIEQTEAAIAKYEALKQGMMHDLFTRGIDLATGQLRPTYADALELYKESELGWIPREWEEETFKDISNVNQGLQIPISLRFKNANNNRYVYITIQFLNDPENESNRYYIDSPPASVICDKNDVLMVRTGNTGMIVTDIIGAFHNNFFKIDYKENVEKEFLVYFLKRAVIQNLIMNYAGTTTIPDLKHGEFYKLPFNRPTKLEQEGISTRLKVIDQKLQTEQSTLAKYQQLKAGLMQDLLTGKVAVEVE